MKTILIFSLFLFSLIINGQDFNGKIIDSLSKKIYTPEFELKLTNQKTNKIYTSRTNQNHEFQFNDLDYGNYELQILNEGYRQNSFQFNFSNSQNQIFYVSKYCRYSDNKSKVCPKCKSINNVLPIFYGLTTKSFMKVNKNNYHFAGCEISNCNPNWYCKEDKLEF